MSSSSRLKTSASVLAAMAGVYAVACASMFFRQREILYRAPRQHDSPDLPVEVVPLCDQGPALMGWIDNPGQAQAVVYFGGSSEKVELRRASMAAAFPEHTRYFVPYRGFAPNHGLKSEEPGIKADALRTFDCVARGHVSVDVIGRSLGTGMAIHVAAHKDVRRLVLITPYDSIIEVASSRFRWLPVRRLLKDKFESWRDALKVTAPTLTILAETDPVTPHRCWENLQKHLKAPLEAIVVPGTDHTTIVQSDLTWNALTAFVEQAKMPTGPELGPVRQLL